MGRYGNRHRHQPYVDLLPSNVAKGDKMEGQVLLKVTMGTRTWFRLWVKYINKGKKHCQK